MTAIPDKIMAEALAISREHSAVAAIRFVWNECCAGELAAGGDLLTPSEVAKLFRVDPKTVTRWAKEGRIAAIRTPGGHRRYPARAVLELATRDSEASR